MSEDNKKPTEPVNQFNNHPFQSVRAIPSEVKDPVEFGKEAADALRLDNPSQRAFMGKIGDKGGIMYAPKGSTPEQLAAAAIGFATVATQGSEFGRDSSDVFGDPNIASKLAVVTNQIDKIWKTRSPEGNFTKPQEEQLTTLSRQQLTLAGQYNDAKDKKEEQFAQL